MALIYITHNIQSKLDIGVHRLYSRYQEYSMKYIYSTSQMSKLSLTLRTFSITGSVAGLFLTLEVYKVDLPILETLLSSLVLTNIKFLFCPNS